MKHLLTRSLLAALLAAPLLALAQAGGVRIGTPGAPDPSAVLDLRPDAAAAPKGFLPPRLTYAQRTGISNAAAGLLVYQNDPAAAPPQPNGYYFYTGTQWLSLLSQGDNLGTHTATQALNLAGNPLVSAAAVGIGTASPDRPLTVQGTGPNSELLSLRNSAGTAKWHWNLGGGGLNLAETGVDDYRLYVAPGGSVGLGTGSPAARLQVVGFDNSTDVIADVQAQNLTQGVGTWYGGLRKTGTLASSDFYLDAKGAGNVLLNAGGGTGGVGIGTGSPQALLDVNGDQNLTGTLKLNTADVDKIFLTSQGAAGSKIGHAVGWGVLNYAGPGVGTGGSHSWLTTGGSGYVEQMRLAPTGLTVTNDLTVAGDALLGLTTVSSTYTLPANNYSEYGATCPAGTRLLSGGGGHRDYNAAVIDVVLNYTGPDPSNPTTRWIIRVDNKSLTQARTVRVYCTCARIR